MSPPLDITGVKFGRLVAVDRCSRNGQTSWRCQCDCGNEAVVALRHLRAGKTKSCGCLNRDISSKKMRAAVSATCRKCGQAIVRENLRQKYCKACAAEKKRDHGRKSRTDISSCIICGSKIRIGGNISGRRQRLCGRDECKAARKAQFLAAGKRSVAEIELLVLAESLKEKNERSDTNTE